MRPPKTKVPGSRSSGNRAAQDKEFSSPESTRLSAYRRRPFPVINFRRFHRWPEGLAYAVGLPWPAGRRSAA
jgi:hypothetical protein